MKWIFPSIFLLLLLIFQCSCINSPTVTPSDCIGPYSSSAFLDHHDVDKEDKIGAYCLIESLNDTTISDCEFADRVFALSDRFGFMMCGIDCQDIAWLKLEKSKRWLTREIIKVGCFEYRASSLFMSGIEVKSCDVENLYSFCKSKIVNDQQYREAFRDHLEEIYDKCK